MSRPDEVRLECDLCRRPIPADAALPLCPRCEASCRAGGKLLAEERRYEDAVRRGEIVR